MVFFSPPSHVRRHCWRGYYLEDSRITNWNVHRTKFLTKKLPHRSTLLMPCIFELCVPCACRESFLCLGHIHLEGLCLNGVAGVNLKQNILSPHKICLFHWLDIINSKATYSDFGLYWISHHTYLSVLQTIGMLT